MKYNALHFPSRDYTIKAYARIGRCYTCGYKVSECTCQRVHIEPDPSLGAMIDRERQARERMTPGSQAYRESLARQAYLEKRLAEQQERAEPQTVGEAMRAAYMLPMQGE